MKKLYMRPFDLETNCQLWVHPLDSTKWIRLDKALPLLEDAQDAYASEAFQTLEAGGTTFHICGTDCEIALVNGGGYIVTEASNLLGR